MKKQHFYKKNKLFITALIVASIASAAVINARWVSLKNDTDTAMTIDWKNARTDATSTMQPGAIGLIEVKPDKWAGSHYAVRDNAIYVYVNGEPANAFDAQEINEYVKTLWDNDSENDPSKFAISFKAEDVDVPNVQIDSYFDKAKQWFHDHKAEAGVAAAAAAAAAAGAYYASQDDQPAQQEYQAPPPPPQKTKENKIKDNLAILGLNPEERDPSVIKKAYRKLALKLHPDKGGSKEDFQDLNNAYHELEEDLGF